MQFNCIQVRGGGDLLGGLDVDFGAATTKHEPSLQLKLHRFLGLSLLPVNTPVDLPTSTSTGLNNTFPKRQTSLPWNDKPYKTINIFNGGLNGPQTTTAAGKPTFGRTGLMDCTSRSKSQG